MVSRERTRVHSPSPPSSPARGEDVDKSTVLITNEAIGVRSTLLTSHLTHGCGVWLEKLKLGAILKKLARIPPEKIGCQVYTIHRCHP